MKKWFGLTLVIMMMITHHAFAQTTDQLLHQLNKASTKAEKIDITTKLAFKYQNQNAYTKAIEYFRELIVLSKDYSHFEIDELHILKNIAFCYEQMGNIEKQIQIHQEILTLVESLHQQDEIIVTLKTISFLYIQNKDFKHALSINQKLLHLLPSSNIIELTQTHNNIGYIYKKMGDDVNARKSFDACYNIFINNLNNISSTNKMSILINLAVIHSQSGYLEKAEEFFEKALEIAQKEKNLFEQARIYNYMAAYEITAKNERTKAKNYLKKAIEILEKSNHDHKDETQLSYSYNLLSELYQKEANWNEYVKYNKLYISTKDHILQKERKLNQLFLEKQLSIEKKENQLKLLMAEKDKKDSELKTSLLQKEARDKELELKEKELSLLRKNQDLQSQILKNEQLEKEKVEQLLIITREKSKTKQHEQTISLLNKNKELHKAILSDKKKEIELLEYKNKMNNIQLREEKTIRLYFTLMIVFLFVLILVSILSFRNHQKKNRELAIQNKHLIEAQQIIQAKNEKLKNYSENLEGIVQERTSVLIKTNQQLIKNNSQLEQYSYILAHNIKAPIARLIGLGIIFKRNIPEMDTDNQFIVRKIDEAIHDLNGVVKDLNVILDIKAGNDAERETFRLRELVNRVVKRLENQIDESHCRLRINIDKEVEIYSVKSYIESIIYNLISNAIKYRSDDRTPIVYVDYFVSENQWGVKVKDNGIGVDIEKYKDKIFGLYKRFHTHKDGKGMGLYLVKVQAESMDGTIELNSIVNEGSEFILTLPIVNA